MPDPYAETIQKILNNARVVASVGVSPVEAKPSHFVPEFLQAHGYAVIPVNPRLDGEALGVTAYDTLADVPEPVDVVQLFIPSAKVGPFVDEAIAIGAKAVWMQLGIEDEEAAERARDAGLDVVMNHCMKVEYKKLFGEENETRQLI